jgi:hypothetical protein
MLAVELKLTLGSGPSVPPRLRLAGLFILPLVVVVALVALVVLIIHVLVTVQPIHHGLGVAPVSFVIAVQLALGFDRNTRGVGGGFGPTTTNVRLDPSTPPFAHDALDRVVHAQVLNVAHESLPGAQSGVECSL